MIGASFDTTKTSLQDLLTWAQEGRLQLPDFQRDWVWDDDRVKNLLASVSASFPIGALMLLETGSSQLRFKPRPLAGTDLSLRDTKPEILVLDGQQRLTSLCQALMSTQAVETKDSKGKQIYRRYYIDMKLAVERDADLDEALQSVPEDGKLKEFGGTIKLDVSSSKKEYAQDLFPMNNIFRSAEWRRAYNLYWRHEPDKVNLFDQFEATVIKRVERYNVPVITMTKETPKEAVCLVFGHVNTGGVPLTVFELLTASFATDDFQLRDDWNARERRLKTKHRVLRNLKSDDFLQAISLLVTQHLRRTALELDRTSEKVPGISCKRKDILNLSVADWQIWANHVEEGFVKAARLLYSQKIFTTRDLPYRTQLVPLAAIFASLGHSGQKEGVRRKIARWYWCGVLGELYGGTTESRFARDLPEVIAYVRDDGEEPSTISESNFQPSRLLTLRTRNSAAYKGIYALLMRDGCIELRTGETVEAQTFFDDKIDIHHIFPEKWCKQSALIEPTIYNSVINKTAISARTNRQIGGDPPSQYLIKVQRLAEIGSERMNKFLESHCIAPEYLRADDFTRFYEARAEELLRRIEGATGKSIPREAGLFSSESTVDGYDEGPPDWDSEP